MPATVTIASRIGRPGCLLLTAGGSFACLDEYWHHGVVAALRLAGPMLLVLTTCWTLWGWPRLVVHNEGIRVDNAWQRICVPWATLRQVRVHWGLLLDTDAGTVRVSAAPLQGGLAASMQDGALSRLRSPASRRQRLASGVMPQAPAAHRDPLGIARLADRPVTVSMDAGRAYSFITERHLEAEGETARRTSAPAGSSAVERSWNWLHVVLLVLGAAGTCWVLL